MIELEENCKRFIDLYLLPKANDEQNKIFYNKMKVYYYKRMVEGNGN